jgi:hypothetical protein
MLDCSGVVVRGEGMSESWVLCRCMDAMWKGGLRLPLRGERQPLRLLVLQAAAGHLQAALQGGHKRENEAEKIVTAGSPTTVWYALSQSDAQILFLLWHSHVHQPRKDTQVADCASCVSCSH